MPMNTEWQQVTVLPPAPGPGRPLLTAAACLGFFLATGCRPAAVPPPAGPPSPPWFADVTSEVGLDFVHDAGPTGEFKMWQTVGSGAAVFDFDGDGRLDIYLLNNGGPKGLPNRLYRQTTDGRFVDASAGSGLDVAGYCMGAAVGDVDNDGRPDLLVTEYGWLRLFLNRGEGKFADVTRAAGLDSTQWGTSAAFFDYDRDGWLDLVVANYAQYDPSWPCFHPGGHRDYCTPTHFPEAAPKLWRNCGRSAAGGVRFEDVTLRSGLGRVTCYGLGVICADFDGDHWPDVFVASDQRPNRLFLNRRDGTFEEKGLLRGVAVNSQGRLQANMGVAIGDVNGDGLFDLFVTHLTDETNALWVQKPRGWFRDQTTAAGLTTPTWPGTGWGTVLADFDHDGDDDLALVNGRVMRAKEPQPGFTDPWGWYAERNQLFANDGAGRFRDVSPDNATFCGTPGVCRGLAYGDFDGDGALDLLVTAVAGPAKLYRNTAPKQGHWLRLRVLEPAWKRDANGAEVTVRAGGRSWTRWLNPGSSYLCSNEPWLHFGLGQAARADGIRVRWPDGTTEEFPGQDADQVVVVRRGEGTRSGEGGTHRAAP